MIKKSLLIAILPLFMFISSCNFSCGKKNNHKKVTIGMVTFPGYAPLYVAKEKHFFGNLEVELVRIESISDLRAAVVTGKIDMYAATYDIFQNSETNPPGIGFLALDRSHGADGIITNEAIKSVADLKGKTIAVEPGLPPYFILQYVLHKEGIKLSDVSIRDIPSQDAANAFVAGKVDIAGTYEPYLSEALKNRKSSKILVSSLNTSNIIIDFLFASENMVKHNPGTLQAIAKGWFKALQYIADNQEDAYKIMGKAFNISPEDMKSFSEVVSWLNQEENKKLFSRQKEQNAYAAYNQVKEVLQYNNSKIFNSQAEEKLTGNIVSNE